MFDGTELPVETVFDTLGWILSITATPAPGTEEVTEKNFLVPLAAMFAKWCRVIVPSKHAPLMAHLAYWKDIKSGKLLTLLGSTPGAPSPIPGFRDTNFDRVRAAAQKKARETAEKKARAAAEEAGKSEEEIEEEVKRACRKAATKATINESPRAYVVIRGRQEQLNNVDLMPEENKEAEPEVDPEGKEMAIGYGRCAETFFYIWAGNYM